MNNNIITNSGIKFDMVNEAGSTERYHGSKKVLSDIKYFFSVNSREAFGRPDFGTQVHQYLFMGLSASTAAIVTETIKDEILQNFRNVRIGKLDYELDHANGKLIINLTLLVGNTVERTNLLFSVQ